MEGKGGKHLLLSAEAPVNVDLSYFSSDVGGNADSYFLWSLQTLACSIGPAYLPSAMSQSVKYRGIREDPFMLHS